MVWWPNFFSCSSEVHVMAKVHMTWTFLILCSRRSRDECLRCSWNNTLKSIFNQASRSCFSPALMPERARVLLLKETIGTLTGTKFELRDKNDLFQEFLRGGIEVCCWCKRAPLKDFMRIAFRLFEGWSDLRTWSDSKSESNTFWDQSYETESKDTKRCRIWSDERIFFLMHGLLFTFV